MRIVRSDDAAASAMPETAAPEAAPLPEGERLGFEAFRALRHRNFRLFFAGQLTSLIGTWMQSVAQGWLVLRLTNSSLMLGLVAFASYMPILAMALFAGVVVDHVDRRRLILLSQALLMINAFVLAGLTWAHVVRVQHVIILAALNGLVSSFDMPGRQAFLVEMVGREDLPNAIAMNSMIFNGARAVGPAIAGVLLAVIGETGCFFLNGVSFLAVIWSLVLIDVPARKVQSFGAVMFKRVREGLVYVWRHRATFYLLLVVGIISGFGIQYTVLVPVFARDLLHGGAKSYGFLMAAQGIGAVAGAIALASRRAGHQGLRQQLVFGAFCLAGAIMVFGFSRWMALSLAAQMAIGVGLMSYMATTNTLLQLFVADELRGRVMSIYTLSFIGMAPIGSLEVGLVGEHAGPRVAVVVCGIITLGCAAYLLTRMKILADAQVHGEAAMAS